MAHGLVGVVDPRLSGHTTAGRLRGALGDDAHVVASGPAIFAVKAGSARQDESGVTCAVDGGLYNAGELRSRLGLAAVGEDAEVFASGWSIWGAEILARARGDFAVALWDSRSERGLLACDHMGGRGLSLVQRDRRLTLASEPVLLERLLDRGLEPDAAGLADWLAVTASPPDRSLFAGVSKLPGGRWLPLPPPRSLAGASYWEPGAGSAVRGSREALADGLRERLDRSVRRRVSGAAPVGIMLSGGLDSSSVAGLAARHVERGRLRGYSAVFPGHPTVDESGLIARLEQANGIPGTWARVRSGSVVAGSVRHLERWRVPPVSPNLFFWEPLLERAYADGVRVLLDGEGGDELFGLAPYLVADRLRRGRLLSARGLVSRAAMGPDPPIRVVGRVLVRFAARGAVPHRLHQAARRAAPPSRYAPAWFSDRLARIHFETTDPWAWKREPGPRWRAHLRSTVAGMGSAAAYEHVRRRAAGAGLAARHPLVDADVVDYMLRLPPEVAYDPHLTRPLFRDAMSGLVPDEVRLRPTKSNFDAVFHEALTGHDRPAIRQLLGGSGLELAAYLKANEVRRLVEAQPDRFPGGLLAWAIYVWRMVTAELWLRQLAGRSPREALAGCRLAPADLDLFHP